MTQANNSLFTRGLLRSLVVLFCAAYGAAHAIAQKATQDPDVFGSAVKSFVAAQQDALSSGDPDRILKSSSPVAVASLALLNGLDTKDQENRKADGALSYAQSLVSDLPTEMLLLKMEVSLGAAVHPEELEKHILSTNPEDAKLHLGLAEILQASKPDDAVREAQRAVELDPKSRDAQLQLGMAYWALNVFQYNEETLRAFTAAHQLDPDGFSTNLLLGSIESQYQHFDDAVLHLRAAMAADASAAEPWYQLGMNAYEQSRTAEAGDLLEHYISMVEAGKDAKPTQVRLALLTLDEIAEEQGKIPDEAHRGEEDALKQMLLKVDASKDAAPSTGAMMGAPDTSDRSPLSISAPAASTMTATFAQLRELAASALLNIGTVLARRQDFAGAVLPFRYAAEEDPDLEPVMRNLGLAAYISGSYEESAQALKKVVAAHPDDTTSGGFLGLAEFETGEYSDAAANFTSLGPALSSNPLYQATAAAAFARSGDRSRAEQALAELKNAAADPQLQAREAVAYLDLDDADRATELAKGALSGGQPAAEALRVLGLLDLERGDAAKAATEFQDAANTDRPGADNQLECQALLAEALIESGKKSEGEDLSQKLVRTNPNLANALAQQGRMLLKKGDAQAAFEKLAAALALAPHDKEIRAALDSARHALHNQPAN